MLHFTLTLDSKVSELTAVVTEFVEQGMKLVPAIKNFDVSKVVETLKQVKDTAMDIKAGVKKYKAKQPQAWYSMVRVLAQLPPSALLQVVGAQDAAAVERRHVRVRGGRGTHVVFFVVELLDALARCPAPVLVPASDATGDAPEATPTGRAADNGGAAASACSGTSAAGRAGVGHAAPAAAAAAPPVAPAVAPAATDAPPLVDARLAAIELLGRLWMDACPLFNGASQRVHIIVRLRRLCTLPTPRLQEAAKAQMRAIFGVMGPPGRRSLRDKLLCCCGPAAPPPRPVAQGLWSKTGVPSAEFTNSSLPDPRFYTLHTLGVDALSKGQPLGGLVSKHVRGGAPASGEAGRVPGLDGAAEQGGHGHESPASELVMRALEHAFPTLAAIERLQRNAELQVAHEADMEETLALYVPLRCAVLSGLDDEAEAGVARLRMIQASCTGSWRLTGDAVPDGPAEGDVGGSRDLHDTVQDWLRVPASVSRVLLLHGQGHSLFSSLLYYFLWRTFDFNESVPLRINLCDSTHRTSNAVAEALQRQCGLNARSAAARRRKWVLILDGYGEVRPPRAQPQSCVRVVAWG